MSWESLRLTGSRNVLHCRSWRMGGGSQQPTFLNWAVGNQKHAACFLACCFAAILATSKHPWFRARNSSHQMGGVLIPSAQTLTHSLGCLTWSSNQDVWCVSESFMVSDPTDGVVPDLGVASLTVVECCQSFYLHGTVIILTLQNPFTLRFLWTCWGTCE